MNIRQLEIFRAVMSQNSAARASELLGISQPAVSRAVIDLEKSIGFALFERVRGRLVPTPEAALLLREVNASFIGIDRLRGAVARIRDLGSGTLRVASLAAMGARLVPRAIADFQKTHPDVLISLQVLLSANVRDLVANEQYDIGIAASEVELAGTDHRIFTNHRGYCAIPAHFPLADKAVVRPEDLHDVPFIALSPEDRTRAQIAEVMQLSGTRPKVVLETPFSMTIAALVAEGAGVGIVPASIVEGFGPGIVLRPFEPEVYFRSYLLFRPDIQRSQLVKDFTAALLRARDRMPSVSALGDNIGA
jgi:DNA-binding transcriptional LysR family regulator